MHCFSFAQDKKAKHVNYYKPVIAETKEISVDIQDAVSMVEFSKFKLRLTNKTNDYILYKPKESLFKLSSGDFVPEDKKTILIQPLDKESKVIDMKAGADKNAHVDNYTFLLGGLYKIVTNSPITEAPAFMLPAASNSFTAGNFTVELLSLSKKTGETSAKFKVTYSGKGAGLVDPKKLAVKVDTKTTPGQMFANDKKEKGMILYQGETDTFTASFHIEGKLVDMQFANMEIIWKDTFKDCQIVKLDETSIELVLDPGMTAGKNK
jgi:hypothetical protein